MANESFDQFVQRLNKPKPEPVDWESTKAQWLDQITKLHELIAGSLQPQIKADLVRIAREPVSLFEEQLGSYESTRMRIEIGSAVVTVEPIGTVLFGAYGRADLKGPAGTTKLVLVEKSNTRSQVKVRFVVNGQPDTIDEDTESVRIGPGDCVWKIAGAPPRTTLTELTKESFLAALMEVADG